MMFPRHSRNPLRLRGWWVMVLILFTLATGSSAQSQPYLRNPNNIVRLVVSPDSSQYVTGHWDRSIRLGDTTSHQLIWEVEQAIPEAQELYIIHDLQFSPNGTQLAVSFYGGSSLGGKIWILDTATGELDLELGANSVGEMDWKPDGTQLAVRTTNGTINPTKAYITVWDTISGNEIIRVSSGYTVSVLGIAWSPDGQQLVNLDRSRVAIWDTNTWTVTVAFNAGESVMALAWDADNSRIAGVDEWGTVYLWDATTGDQEMILASNNQVSARQKIAWDDEYGIAVSTTDQIVGWNPHTGEQTFAIDSPNLNGLEWLPNGDLIYTSGTLKTVQVVSPFQDEALSSAAINISPRLIFASDRDDGDGQTYIMNPDGTDVQIFGEDRTYITPTCSSNGEYLAVVSDAIYVMKADGSGVERIEVERIDPYSGISISNDGTKVAFVSLRDTNSEIYLVNTDGTNEMRFTNTVAGEVWPVISPDGTKLLFISIVDNIGTLFISNMDGTNQTLLVEGVRHASWSPDGTQIVFTSTQNGLSDISKINADGTNLTQLISHPSADYQPRWSPDGNRIAFVSKRDGNMEIYTMDTNGQDIQRVTNDPEFDDQPCWLNMPAE